MFPDVQSKLFLIEGQELLRPGLIRNLVLVAAVDGESPLIVLYSLLMVSQSMLASPCTQYTRNAAHCSAHCKVCCQALWVGMQGMTLSFLNTAKNAGQPLWQYADMLAGIAAL